ncbi:MAG TPA: KUP/HAK/KT family potassium transporter [Luteibaculaceae bacterium]|nr:KUP/HAK/KT family potassium transporter [Luteibaculaceae bacterium]
MGNTHSGVSINKVTMAGMLVAIGIVFGDIGTSPLYAYRAIVGERPLDEVLILGGLSCVFWTLTFQTTLKYVIITLQADNKGEGGIFSLYALVRRHSKPWMLVPAIIGGSFLVSDGIITPPISVSSAIEGLQKFYPDLNTIPIVLAIITGLFVVQQFGTHWIGRIFGPVMLTWFGFIAVIGAMAVANEPGILKAVSPVYAYRLLAEYPEGFWILGAVFLCTTGAEALYSDIGHCGKGNVRISWIFVKISLLISYAGQGAWMLGRLNTELGDLSPFYEIVPHFLLIPSIVLATLAAIIASQALISGSFTLVSEAIRLNLSPRLFVEYPSNVKGQLYIPFINWMMLLGCIIVVLYFKKSANMEAAYGLAVTVTMIMSTILMTAYLHYKRYPIWLIVIITGTFLTIECSFLVANMLKFHEGGWISIMSGAVVSCTMAMWFLGKKIKSRLTTFIDLPPHIDHIRDLSTNQKITKYATHLVFLTASPNPERIEQKVIYSIFSKRPKRADFYWFVHINVLDEPYTMNYKVETLVQNDIYYVTFNLGFRVEPRVNLFFRMVVKELAKTREIIIPDNITVATDDLLEGDFKFIVHQHFMSHENDLPVHEKFIMNAYFLMRKLVAVKEEVGYGLDTSNVQVEKVPLVIARASNIHLVRLK